MSDSFGVYVHVPFCSSRCGYCDFNTYTPGELGGTASPESYLDALEKELELAAASGTTRPATTVFIGGGTPSMLGASGLTRVLSAVRNTIGIALGAEVTTESNPETTSPEFFSELLESGYNRISLGMQSASSSVLRVLERKHTPGRAFDAAREAMNAGFLHVNLDMIYGTPTETDDDVRLTLERALDTGVDHISAYSLIVEDGTAMARKVRKGQLPPPNEDVYADRYGLIDTALRAQGFDWYEVSNWAKPGGECQHNLGYWLDGDWWGAGPGAYSHIASRRFFNVKHPSTYAQHLAQGQLPIKEEELLDSTERHEESVMLGLRLRQGLELSRFTEAERAVIEKYVGLKLLHIYDGRVASTLQGRLLIDGIIADILVAY
ncbi:radical SAM family heme chaperone HemW [Corynebacterium diphtheriae]|uniref:radical SAM family heme chaperone HemW n=1 Tax=Corynebacterium diphtheriae TaxID=1717 RepID=UPI00202BA865|nr:radical SAM family heme chaperone HemW [Corynebacterium diphtheriae]MCM0016286.1 radical SAM family heme chaperone HemW [Corynebacterium diphtheriae bv. mitis]MCM0025994.1 radical SAM family heme chaperone HemW [Corynebacterium diphtheriae bv. mitis]MCM0057930.1 radical SAM family heme chaperone HemW [Corynebacterium diphtheriae bv. mitis]MCM0062817.1 radical SAM family heme chaperone HemW [Corynebacterium diphtheriae bv. mitis]MCM0064967.1 radical SAM family heme chaperone HemW [Corynebact